MPLRLNTRAKDFEARFAGLLAAKRETSEDVDTAVSEILADVRSRGDKAVIELTGRFDRVRLSPETLRVGEDEWDAAVGACEEELFDALRMAHQRIFSFHERQLPENLNYTDSAGVKLGYRWTPVAAAGLYVPGGTAAYPSSVLMNAVPARVAGVGRLAMTVPAPDGRLNPLVLAAARICGVDEVYRIGGAQAIGALAYGTATIPAVDVIVGPGNAYVAAAKRQVFGQVGIDMVAGPSEVLVVADGHNDPDWIAADLLAQAEHDTAAQSILVTDDEDFATAVAAAVEAQLKLLPREKIASASWRDNGAIVLVRSLDEAVPLVDRIAPEHLQVAVAGAEDFANRVRNAGAIFVGRYTPEAIGDYVAGPNHVLPTARSARFASGLGVLDFMKRTTLLRCDAASLARLAPAAMVLGHAEGLQAHARSVAIRLNTRPGR